MKFYLTALALLLAGWVVAAGAAALAAIPPALVATPALIQVTQGGCCVQPAFSPDSRQVLFIDKPANQSPVGVYGISLDDALPAQPQLVNATVGFYSPDRAIVGVPAGDSIKFTNQTTGQSWLVNTGGHRPDFSPDGRQLVWVATDREGPYDQRRSDVWLANLDGSHAQKLLTLYGGGFSGWYPDGRRILLVGLENIGDEEQKLISYRLDTGQQLRLARHKRIRGVEISPGGSWVVYYVDFAADDAPADRGIWAVSGDGVTRQKLAAPGFGAYRWRNDATLLLLPMRATATDSMQLWAIEVAQNRAAPLTNPATLPFSVSNGDWDVALNGRAVVFVSSADHNIWLINLP